mgnify:CR=1
MFSKLRFARGNEDMCPRIYDFQDGATVYVIKLRRWVAAAGRGV